MVLKNKLGIKEEIELAKVEEKITKEKAIELFDTGKDGSQRHRTSNASAMVCLYADGLGHGLNEWLGAQPGGKSFG